MSRFYYCFSSNSSEKTCSSSSRFLLSVERLSFDGKVHGNLPSKPWIDPSFLWLILFCGEGSGWVGYNHCPFLFDSLVGCTWDSSVGHLTFSFSVTPGIWETYANTYGEFPLLKIFFAASSFNPNLAPFLRLPLLRHRYWGLDCCRR